MRLSRIAGLCMVLFVASFSAQAQEKPLQSVLTETNIRGFFGALNELQTWADDHEKEFAAMSRQWESRGVDDPSSFAEAMAALQNDSDALHSDVRRIISRHSFEGPEHWGRVGQALFLSIANAKLDQQEPELKKGLSDAMKRMEALGLSDEQKKAMQDAMGEIETARRDMSEGVHPADLRLVRDNLEWIEEILAEMEQRPAKRSDKSAKGSAAAGGGGGR